MATKFFLESNPVNPIYSISLNISHTGLHSTMWARAKDILLEIIPAYGLLVACRQTTVSGRDSNDVQSDQQLVITFAIVNIPLMISWLFLTGRILRLLPKNLAGKKVYS